MFKRRERRSVFRFFYEVIFSLKGISRAIGYVGIRLKRIPDTPHKISLGMSCGIFASFTPLFGLHFLIAGLLSYVFRANVLASLIGTFVGNPFTFPFIWIFIYKVGNIFFKNDQNFSLELTFQSLFDQGYDILIPMMIGSLIVSIPVWFISYFTVKFLMSSFKKRKA